MIEILSQSRCIQCDKCVKVCPTNVFDAVPGESPVIARQEDCQTCFLCEAYCPADALFVDARAEERVVWSEEELVEKDLFGAYRRNLGWAKGGSPIDNLKKIHALRELVGSPF
jgi:NAD-dependent dihydropyrimidine dehydrogenase PreA subunit